MVNPIPGCPRAKTTAGRERPSPSDGRLGWPKFLRACVYGGNGQRVAVVKDFSSQTTDPRLPNVFNKVCDFTDNMNNNRFAQTTHKCYPPYLARTNHCWRGDGAIIFDVKGDGLGKRKVQLKASPAI